jgi:pseudouridine-5'-phosphate glycosidase
MPPTVALESTVISHGLPYPHNLRLALRLEEIVAAAGAAPATVGVIAGEIVVGLSRGQIEHLATASVHAWGTKVEARYHKSALTGRGCPPIMPFGR